MGLAVKDSMREVFVMGAEFCILSLVVFPRVHTYDKTA